MEPREHRFRAVGAADLDREMFDAAIVGAKDVQPPRLGGFHGQARGGHGHQVVMTRQIVGGVIGGKAGQAGRAGHAAGVIHRHGQHAGQKLRRFRQQDRETMQRRVALAHGLQRPLQRRDQVARRIGDIGQPCGVGVLRHHDPRQIAVIGPRLERSRPPRRDRYHRARAEAAQGRDAIRGGGLGGKHEEPCPARRDDEPARPCACPPARARRVPWG